jgi:hypothetical protein
MKKSIIAAVLAATSLCALANDYYLVVPVPHRHANATEIQVLLNAYALPPAQAGQAYEGFDFASVLQVSGDPAFDASSVRFAVSSGALPTGMSLSAAGKLSGTPSQAGPASFEVAATYKTKDGKHTYQLDVAAAIVVSLTSATLPTVQVGSPYTLSLSDYLTVTGDTSYNPQGVAWALGNGALPPGLTLQADGRVTGTPTAVYSSPFEVSAQYKGQSVRQTYAIQATGRFAQFDPSTILKGTTPMSPTASNTAVNTSGTVWTVNARPSGNTGVAFSIDSNAVAGADDSYMEVVSATNSAWIFLGGATDGQFSGIALDGAACQRNNVYAASCTSNSAGNWAGARIGIRYQKALGRITFYRNGTQVFQQTGVPAQVQRLRVLDRDSPVNSKSRTYSLYNSPASWSYAPAGVQPFSMD